MEYFLKIKYEDGREHWIKEPMEVDGLPEAERAADKKVKQLNNQFVSSITGRVVEWAIYSPSFCKRKVIKDDITKKQS